LAIRRLKGTHTLFKYYADAERFRKRTSKTRDRLRKEEPDIRRRLNLLRPDQLEDPLNQAFTNLRTEQERLQNILDHKPVYLDDAIDKLIFYDREIKGKEDQVLNMAEAEFGSDYEKNIFAGYGKIFGEFLGHMAVTYEQLTLEGYKERVIRKIKSK
ncbi:hypothetical protein HYU23_04170, partial [Candidatus Woesearchaeota archaeon]|nr:hypothetical protein [Candidatus Woesearchaeota archaeon]